MVHHLERTSSKEKVAMINDGDSLSSGEASTSNPCNQTNKSHVPKVEVDHCSDGSSSQKDSDSPPSSPTGYNLLRDSQNKEITPAECMHLLIDRLDSSSSTAQFLKNNDTDPSLSTSDEGDYPNGVMPFSPGVSLMLKTNDIGFIHWNWPRIRMICTICFWSSMCALLALAIGLIVTAPKTCEPERSWYQGAVFYEIFPSAFQDTNHDGVGDLQGVITHLNYIQSLGVSAIRLNAIYESDLYPSRYWATLNHTNVAANIGTLQDFQNLIDAAHQNGLKVVLDFNPLFISKEHPFTDPANFESNGRTGHRYFFIKNMNLNESNATTELQFKDTAMLNLSHEFIQNKMEEAMEFWLSKNVDGFYIKYLEHVDVKLGNIRNAIKHWRTVIDKYSYVNHVHRPKALICSGNFADKLKREVSLKQSQSLLQHFDLIDYNIQMISEESENLPQQLTRRTNDSFGQTVYTPWIMWSVGSAENSRLANRVGSSRCLATTIIHLLLPGSVNLFYGDEIYLKDDITQPSATSALVPMKWSSENMSIDTQLSFAILKNVLYLRNSRPPLLNSFLIKSGEDFNTPNYRIRIWQSSVLVLERFYPRSSSLIILANLNQTKQQLDISSLFYQGKVVLSTHAQEDEYIKFNHVLLKSGELLITEI